MVMVRSGDELIVERPRTADQAEQALPGPVEVPLESGVEVGWGAGHLRVTLIEPGASTRAHVAFSPLAAHAHRDTLVVETERGPDVGVAVVGRGKASLADGVAGHDPAAEHDDEDARRDQREAAARQDAHAGEAPLVFTYDQLDAAFTARARTC